MQYCSRGDSLITTVAFDMGGVLIDFDTDRVLREHFDARYHDVLNEKVFHADVWARLDEGTERAEDAVRRVVPELPEPVRPKITEMLMDFYPYMPPKPDSAALVRALKEAGYRVLLLSNATPRVFDHYLDYPALTMMDGFLISALYKTLKPRREIYDLFCRKFGLRPEECFFTDDRADNVEGARAYGMQAAVFTDVASLKDALREAGVTI